MAKHRLFILSINIWKIYATVFLDNFPHFPLKLIIELSNFLSIDFSSSFVWTYDDGKMRNGFSHQYGSNTYPENSHPISN